jgi:hypothetical protein
MTWKLWDERFIHGIEDDENYLISYKDYEGKYSHPIRAYYIESEDAMFPIDSSFAFPLYPTIYMSMPKTPNEKAV